MFVYDGSIQTLKDLPLSTPRVCGSGFWYLAHSAAHSPRTLIQYTGRDVFLTSTRLWYATCSFDSFVLGVYGFGARVLEEKRHANDVISHKVFLKLLYQSQFPHKFVNILFISVIVKDKLMDLWGSWHLQNDCKTLCVR